ncbi:MAG TPA: hypothetical protein VJT16_14885 [Streptosporangiaceae bacterium]|nr:hypothetical protein [Streptosporangiaceae bacterium]
MDPAIAGTLIGGGFALIGVGASIWATSRTLKANREMAQDERLWEKRSALYEEILAIIGPGLDLSATPRDLQERLGGLLGRVFAYASSAIWRQYLETMQTFSNDELFLQQEKLVLLIRDAQQGKRRGSVWRLLHRHRDLGDA